MNDLSLFGIESGLHDLFDAWQNAETPEQMEAAEVAILACAEAEVRKVDGVRRYWRACEQMAAAAKHEAQVQAERARLWEARLGRLKAIVYEVMERFGRPKLEGQTGTLYLKGNGGKQAVEITDASMIPPEFCDISVRMTLLTWTRLMKAANIELVATIKSEIIPVSFLIAEALARNCERCGGKKYVTVPDTWLPGNTEDVQCSACGGSGKQGVPGARLAERGKHVECK